MSAIANHYGSTQSNKNIAEDDKIKKLSIVGCSQEKLFLLFKIIENIHEFFLTTQYRYF